MSEQQLGDDNENLKSVREQHASLRKTVYEVIESLEQTLNKEIRPERAKALENAQRLRGQQDEEEMELVMERFAFYQVKYVQLKKQFLDYRDMLIMIDSVEALCEFYVVQRKVFAGLELAMAPYVAKGEAGRKAATPDDEVYPISNRLRERIDAIKNQIRGVTTRFLDSDDSSFTIEEVNKAKAEFRKRLGISVETPEEERQKDLK